MFTLAISYLTMLNLPWFTDLILQFLFFTASDFAFITKHTHNWTSFPLWLAASLSLELFVLFLGSYPVVYWTPSNLGGLSFGVISFCLFIQFMGFSWQVYWSSLPFPPPVDHICQNSPLADNYSLSGKQPLACYRALAEMNVAVSSRKLEIPREHFMQKWAR